MAGNTGHFFDTSSNKSKTSLYCQVDEEAVARLYVKGIKEFYNHLMLYLCVTVVYGYLNISHGMGDTTIIFFGLGLWSFGLLIHGLVAFEKINFMGLGSRWEEQVIAKKRRHKR